MNANANANANEDDDFEQGKDDDFEQGKDDGFEQGKDDDFEEGKDDDFEQGKDDDFVVDTGIAKEKLKKGDEKGDEAVVKGDDKGNATNKDNKAAPSMLPLQIKKGRYLAIGFKRIEDGDEKNKKAMDEKKADEKKADEKKADEKKADESITKNVDEKPAETTAINLDETTAINLDEKNADETTAINADENAMMGETKGGQGEDTDSYSFSFIGGLDDMYNRVDPFFHYPFTDPPVHSTNKDSVMSIEPNKGDNLAQIVITEFLHPDLLQIAKPDLLKINEYDSTKINFSYSQDVILLSDNVDFPDYNAKYDMLFHYKNFFADTEGKEIDGFAESIFSMLNNTHSKIVQNNNSSEPVEAEAQVKEKKGKKAKVEAKVEAKVNADADALDDQQAAIAITASDDYSATDALSDTHSVTDSETDTHSEPDSDTHSVADSDTHSVADLEKGTPALVEVPSAEPVAFVGEDGAVIPLTDTSKKANNTVKEKKIYEYSEDNIKYLFIQLDILKVLLSEFKKHANNKDIIKQILEETKSCISDIQKTKFYKNIKDPFSLFEIEESKIVNPIIPHMVFIYELEMNNAIKYDSLMAHTLDTNNTTQALLSADSKTKMNKLLMHIMDQKDKEESDCTEEIKSKCCTVGAVVDNITGDIDKTLRKEVEEPTEKDDVVETNGLLNKFFEDKQPVYLNDKKVE